MFLNVTSFPHQVSFAHVKACFECIGVLSVRQICLWNSYLVVIYRDLDPSADLELQILVNWKSEPAVFIMLRFGDLVRMRLISVSYIYFTFTSID